MTIKVEKCLALNKHIFTKLINHAILYIICPADNSAILQSGSAIFRSVEPLFASALGPALCLLYCI